MVGSSSSPLGRVVITGACGGIGAAACVRLARDGYPLGLIDLDAEATRRAAQGYPNATAAASDLSTPAACAKALAACLGENESLWGLVHLAGVFASDPKGDPNTRRAAWDSILGVNLTTAHDIAEAARPRMPRGRMVFASSLAFRRGAPRFAAYAAAKAGLIGLTRSLALAWAPDVLVNALAPGLIDTPMLAPLRPAVKEGRALTMIPMGRVGRPEEIAAVIAFLMAEENSYMTGQTLNVDGGAHFS